MVASYFLEKLLEDQQHLYVFEGQIYVKKKAKNSPKRKRPCFLVHKCCVAQSNHLT